MEEEGKEIVVEEEEVDHSSYLNAPSLGEHRHILFSPRGRSLHRRQAPLSSLEYISIFSSARSYYFILFYFIALTLENRTFDALKRSA